MAADLHIITFDPARVPIGIVREYTAPEPPLDREDPSAWNMAAERRQEISGFLYNFNGAVDYQQWQAPWADAIWVGEVSWAKASDNPANHRKWVPRTVEQVQRIYDRQAGIVRITPAVISAIMVAFSAKHDSHFDRHVNVGTERAPRWVRHRGVAKAREVKKFLTANMGQYSFVDSW